MALLVKSHIGHIVQFIVSIASSRQYGYLDIGIPLGAGCLTSLLNLEKNYSNLLRLQRNTPAVILRRKHLT